MWGNPERATALRKLLTELKPVAKTQGELYGRISQPLGHSESFAQVEDHDIHPLYLIIPYAHWPI